MRRHLQLAAALALAAAAACSSSPPPSTPPNPSAWPVAADQYEGAAGDGGPATASTITVGERQVRTLFPDGDVDYVKVALTGGVAYELTANRLSANADVTLALLDTDGSTQLAFNDDYLDADARLLFTAPTSATYYLRVESFQAYNTGHPVGLAGYTLGAHLFVDADGDGWSSSYDCKDGDPSIHPTALEVTADGVDQDCDGMDAPDPAVADRAEPDDTPATARVMAVAAGNPWEYIFTASLTTSMARTIHLASEVDWFQLTVPARAAYDLAFRSAGTQGNVQLTVYDADATTVLRAPGSLDYRLANPTAAARTCFLKYSVTSGTSFYVPFAIPVGVDQDGDGAYTQDRDGARDCNDADATVHPGATEAASDTVDRNCNGVIGL